MGIQCSACKAIKPRPDFDLDEEIIEGWAVCAKCENKESSMVFREWLSEEVARQSEKPN